VSLTRDTCASGIDDFNVCPATYTGRTLSIHDFEEAPLTIRLYSGGCSLTIGREVVARVIQNHCVTVEASLLSVGRVNKQYGEQRDVYSHQYSNQQYGEID